MIQSHPGAAGFVKRIPYKRRKLLVMLLVAHPLLTVVLTGWNPAPVSAQEARWNSTENSMIYERSGHTATLLQPPQCKDGTAPSDYPCGDVLVAGGRRGNRAESVELYDPSKRKWRPTVGEGMIRPRQGHRAILLANGKVLVVGGRVPAAEGPGVVTTNTSELFDPRTEVWTSCTAEAANADCPGPTNQTTHGLILLSPSFCDEGDAPPGYPCDHVISVSAQSELFDPGQGKWRLSEGRMNLDRWDQMAFAFLSHDCGDNCGKVLVAGGHVVGDLTYSAERSAELFDPITEMWTFTAPLPFPRKEASAVTMGSGKILLAGGVGVAIPFGTDDPTPQSELFDPIRNIWEPAPPLNGFSRSAYSPNSAVALPSDRALNISSDLASSFADIYHSEGVAGQATGRWSRSDAIPQPVSNFTLTALGCDSIGGRVLLAGGTVGQSAINSSSLYDRVPTVHSISSAAGPASGGTTLTVKGLGFKPVLPGSPGEIVAIVGGNRAQVTRVSETELKVTTPSGTPGTSAPIQVTVDGVLADTCDKEYKFDYLPLPSITDIVPNVGPATGGSTVTLTGSGLAGATSVKFGGTEIPESEFQVNQEGTKLTLKSPSGDPGTVQVTIQTPGGISPPGQFTFVPVVSSLSPSAGDLGGGTPVIIRGKGFEHVRSVRFGTTEAPFEKRSDTEIQTTSPANRVPELVPVTVTSFPETNPGGLPSMAAAAGSNLFNYTAGVAVPPTGEGLGATAPSSGGTRVQTPSGPGTGSSGGSQPPPSGPASLSSLVQNQAPNLEIMNQIATQQSTQASSAGQIGTARGLVDTGVVHSPKAAIAPRLEPNPQEAPQYHMVGRDDQANLAPGVGLALTSMLLSCLVIGGLGVRRGLDTPTDYGERPAPAWGYVT